jgi:hypothetical protein
MGRRSRKRSGTAVPAPSEERATPAPSVAPSTPRRRAKLEEAPKAPWHPVPLVELSILAGLILSVIGFLSEGDRRPVLIVGGLALIAVASCELAIREHFAGYRSHSALLALLLAFGVGAVCWFASEDRYVVIAGAAIAFGPAFWAMRRSFVDRSGGLTWRA